MTERQNRTEMGGKVVYHYMGLKLSSRRARSLQFRGSSGGSGGKESPYNAKGPGSIHRLGRSPGDGNGNPLHYSFLENSMD